MNPEHDFPHARQVTGEGQVADPEGRLAGGVCPAQRGRRPGTRRAEFAVSTTPTGDKRRKGSPMTSISHNDTIRRRQSSIRVPAVSRGTAIPAVKATTGFARIWSASIALAAALQLAAARRAERREIDAWLGEHPPSAGRATG